MSRHEVQQFFERYRAAFDRLDGDAVADHWHLPSAIAQTGSVTVWQDGAPIRANMRRLCEGYRTAGYHHAEFELADHVALGRDAAFANLRWTISRADGSVLQSFRTSYNLIRRGAAGAAVVLCTAYEEGLAHTKGDDAAQ